MHYKAVIFDLDGTLINSLEDLAESANKMLESYGYPTHSLEAYKQMIGNGVHELMKRCMPDNIGADRIAEGAARYKEIYKARFLEKTRSYEGILDVLKELSIREIPMAVCTNKPTEDAHTIVEVLFEKDTFREVIGDEPGLPRKPDPAKVLAIADRFGVLPEETVYIGDSMVDMKTAVHANMLPVGVLWGFRDQQELEDNGARVLLEHPKELLQKIEFIEDVPGHICS